MHVVISQVTSNRLIKKKDFIDLKEGINVKTTEALVITIPMKL